MSVLLADRTDGVLTLTLNRPEALNAFTEELLRALGAAVAEAGNDPATRAVVITGAGRGFCAGQDLKELEERDTTFQAVLEGYNPLVSRIATLGKPVIAAVNGAAAGAGLSLALACDLRVASSSAVFVTTFTRIGLTADSGMSYFLPRLVGWGKAFELLALSPRVSAEEALALGLVNQVAAPDELAAAARNLASRLAQGPTAAYGFIKQALRASATSNLDDVLALEARLQDQAGATRDYHEGVVAFKEKRSPVFTGA